MAAHRSVRSGSVVRGARYKRPFDLAVLAFGLVVLLPVWPVVVAAIALAVRLSGPGPVLYRQARLGRGGREFRILKFRTMAPDAEERTGPVWATWNDARTTPVGRVLRRHHLDELPQALNVLRGEMSLVGPRPERPALAARIERGLPGFGERLAVLPGIAGLAQARGRSRRRHRTSDTCRAPPGGRPRRREAQQGPDFRGLGAKGNHPGNHPRSGQD